MNKIYVLLVSALLTMSAGVGATVTAAQNAKDKSNTQLLFLAAAPKAVLTQDKNGSYELTVSNALGNMAYFTNRPERKSGLIEVDKFITLWTNKEIKNNFATNPPNVAVAMLMENGHKQSFIAIMNKPLVKGNLITYPLTKISKNKITTGTSVNTIIFIDDVTWNPGGF